MIKLLGNLPRNIGVAFSGGVDSIAALDFLSRNHNVKIVHFNHGETDPTSNEMEHFANSISVHYDCELILGHNKQAYKKGQSLEEFWRDCRYEWMHSLDIDVIVVAHHLDDCVETWVWSALHGTPKTIPYKRGRNVYRPFLLNPKKEFENWVKRKKLAYYEDPTNSDLNKTRNYVRKELLPHCYKVNPGLRKVVMKKILENEKYLLTRDTESYIV